MGILSSPIPDVAATRKPTPARLLKPTTRQQLALDALAGQPITTLANQQQVSRKFVYQQLHHAHDALDHALHTATPVVRYLDHRAYDAIATRSRLQERQARRQHRQGRKDLSLAAQLR